MGPFNLVLTSEVSRTLETAVAMGLAVDRQLSIPGDIRAPAIAVLGHHERWSWPEPWVRFADLVRQDGPVATFGGWLRAAWVDALESTGHGGRVLIVSHGRDIEAGVVMCLDEMSPAEFLHWGEPLHHCEGVRLSYASGRFCDPIVIRTRGWGTSNHDQAGKKRRFALPDHDQSHATRAPRLGPHRPAVALYDQAMSAWVESGARSARASGRLAKRPANASANFSVEGNLRSQRASISESATW